MTDETKRECEPSTQWVHLRGGHHWGTCEVHMLCWYIGQNLTEIPAEFLLDEAEREKFFSEYKEGHCPGY